MGTHHKKRVPEDLMGAILGAGSGPPDEEQESAARGEAVSGQPTGATVSWEKNPERVGVAFNLSKQVSTELDRIRLELEDDTRPSKSEIAEMAFRIAIEDVRSRGRQSETRQKALAKGPTSAGAPAMLAEAKRTKIGEMPMATAPRQSAAKAGAKPESRRAVVEVEDMKVRESRVALRRVVRGGAAG